jgi:uncharacterized protein (DUF58 family)
MTFTRRAVGSMIVIVAATVFIPTWIGVVLSVVIVAAAVADAWTVRTAPQIERTAPPILSRGVVSSLTVTSGDSAARLRQSVWSPDLRVDPPEGTGHLRSAVVAARRGDHRLAPVSTMRTGPLGLGGWIHLVGDPHALTVYPDLPAARRLATEVRLGLFREEGRRARGPLGLGTELESIREYLPDDDIRQVNWRATVRTGRPMSNTYRIEQDRDVICLLDCGRLMASPVTRSDGEVLTRLDAAVDAVAATAAVADELGDRIGVVAFADRLLRVIAPRRDGSSIVLDAVHDLEPIGVDSDYEAAIASVAGRKRAFVLVLTDILDPGAARPLLASLPTLTRRHMVSLATVRDPAVQRALETPSEDVADLARTVVAADVAERRDLVAAELLERGTDVIDAPVESLSRRCVGAYVRAKRLARV